MSNSQDKAGGPAFPVFEEQYHYGLGEKVVLTKFNGMTLRDYFAAKAIAAFAADAKRGPGTLYMNYPTAAREAYAIADAMLAAREAQ